MESIKNSAWTRVTGFFITIVLFFIILFFTAPVLFIHLVFCMVVAKGNSRWSDYGKHVFTAWDGWLNVILAPLFRWIFNYPKYDFGYSEETTSKVIIKNAISAQGTSDKSLVIVSKILIYLIK